MAGVTEFIYHVDEFLETFIGDLGSESDSEAEAEEEEEEDFGPALFYPSHVTDPFTQSLESAPSFEREPNMGSDYLGIFLDDPQPFDPPTQQNQGLRIAGFLSDSESESEIDPSRWDCLGIGGEIQNPDPGRTPEQEDFEWEEVSPERHVDQQDWRRMIAETDAFGEDQDEEVDLDLILGRSDVAWEVLMSEGGLEEEMADSVQMSEYEILASQIDNAIQCGNPPAAKDVVESLPTILLSSAEKEEAVTCAICKDEMGVEVVEEKVTKLPCGHFYHKDCIVPWLGIRNSCPVCRFELPTDDPNYENWKDGSGNRANGSGAGLVELLDRLELDWAV